MSDADVTTTDVEGRAWWQPLARIALVVVACVLIVVGFRAFDRMTAERATTYTTSWTSWLWWMVLLTLAGLAFGLAAMLPSRLRIRPGRALLLGAAPLLFLVYLTMMAGPGGFVYWANVHLRFIAHLWLGFVDIMQVGFVACVLLGIAIAAGLGSGSA